MYALKVKYSGLYGYQGLNFFTDVDQRIVSDQIQPPLRDTRLSLDTDQGYRIPHARR
jgi:hypothetical protein